MEDATMATMLTILCTNLVGRWRSQQGSSQSTHTGSSQADLVTAESLLHAWWSKFARRSKTQSQSERMNDGPTETCNESGRIPHTCLVLSRTYVKCFSNGKDGRCGFVLGCGEALIPSVNVALNYAFRPMLSRRRQYESIILRFGFCWPLRALINYILHLLTDDRYSNGPL